MPVTRSSRKMDFCEVSFKPCGNSTYSDETPSSSHTVSDGCQWRSSRRPGSVGFFFLDGFLCLRTKVGGAGSPGDALNSLNTGSERAGSELTGRIGDLARLRQTVILRRSRQICAKSVAVGWHRGTKDTVSRPLDQARTDRKLRSRLLARQKRIARSQSWIC